MCNQIADNVGGHLSTAQAADKVLNHITLFWAKSMKADLIRYYKTDGQQLNQTAKLATENLIKNQEK